MSCCPELRTALTVCQAIIIAITVVLPAPVANFNAMRNRSGLLLRLARSMSPTSFFVAAVACGATSVNQIAVSTASIWQKNGRTSLNE